MEPFLYQVASDLKSRFGEGLSDVAIVFTNKRSTLFLKKYLLEVYGRTMITPPLFTIQEFLALSTDKAVANSLSRFFTLFEGYNELLKEENKDQVSTDFFYPMSTTLLMDFDQIDYDLVNPDAVYRQLKDVGELRQQFHEFTPEQQDFLTHFWSSFSSERQSDVQQKFIELWKRLPRLYRLYRHKLARQKLIDMASVYRELAEGKAGRVSFTDAFSSIAFVGFNALNKCEATVFRKWQQENKAVFYFDADAYYFNDSLQEAGNFLRKNILQYGLKNALGNFPNQLNTSQKSMVVHPVEGFTAQAKCLSLFLNSTKNDSEESLTNKAIILADENLLIPVLQSVPNAQKLNVTMGFPIKHSQVFRILNVWFELQQKLQTNSGRKFPLSATDLNRFIGLNLPGFSGGHSNETFRKLLEEIDEHGLQKIVEYNEATRLFFTRYSSGMACLTALQQIVILLVNDKANNHPLKAIEANLWLRVFQELNMLKDQLENYRAKLTVELALRLAWRHLASLSTALSGEPLQGLQIMGMLESRCLDFDEIFLVGANEGVLPKHHTLNSFIPDSLRRAYGLPLSEHQESLSAYSFYRLCQRAKTIHVFYNDLVDNNSTGEVSRFVSQLKFESLIHIETDKLLLGHRHESSAPEITYEIEKTPQVLEEIARYFNDGDKSFSASSLKTFLDCPLQYFVQKIARLPEPDEPQEPFSPLVFGTAFHAVMESFYQPFCDAKTTVTAEAIRSHLDTLPNLCHDKLRDALPLSAATLNREDSRWKIAEKILLENVRLVLRHDEKNVAPFKVLALEEEFKISVPLEFEGASQPVITHFLARIDRIDEVSGRIRIVDYKTGGDETGVENIESLFDTQTKKRNSSAFQALLYSLLYFEKTQKTAEPHLYVTRNLQKEPTFIHFKNSNDSIGQMEDWLPIFKKYLSELIARIRDPKTAFSHNPDANYCRYATYHFFCESTPDYEEEEDVF